MKSSFNTLRADWNALANLLPRVAKGAAPEDRMAHAAAVVRSEEALAAQHGWTRNEFVATLARV